MEFGNNACSVRQIVNNNNQTDFAKHINTLWTLQTKLGMEIMQKSSRVSGETRQLQHVFSYHGFGLDLIAVKHFPTYSKQLAQNCYICIT